MQSIIWYIVVINNLKANNLKENSFCQSILYLVVLAQEYNFPFSIYGLLISIKQLNVLNVSKPTASCTRYNIGLNSKFQPASWPSFCRSITTAIISRHILKDVRINVCRRKYIDRQNRSVPKLTLGITLIREHVLGWANSSLIQVYIALIPNTCGIVSLKASWKTI